MTHFLLRFSNFPILLLIVIFGIALQSSLFASYPLLYLQPDIVLITVVWVALKRRFFEGGVLTLLFALISESHSGAPQGVFMSSYMAIYLLIRASASYFLITKLSSIILLTLFASIIWKLIGLFILHLLNESVNQWRHTLSLMLPGAVMEGVVGIWIYRWLDQFDWVTFKNPRAREAYEDQILLDDEGL